MNHPRSTDPATPRPSGLPVAEVELDADLQRTVRRTAYMRQGFYMVVLLVALAGQVTGAVETMHIPLLAALPAVSALELGGNVVLANADVRRRLGERAVASRLLSAVIAAGAVAFNWLAHADHLRGAFFAGMSALGYLVWLMHTENQRRDRLRAKGDLAWTTPAYEVVGHWLAHPWLTRRARALAKADPHLGLYDSLAAARTAVRRERRQSAIAKVLHRKIRAAVDPTTADIAVHVYDLDEIALRLADGADYDGLTALIAVDLAPARLAAGTAGKRGAIRSTVDGQVAPRHAMPALASASDPAQPTPAIERGPAHHATDRDPVSSADGDMATTRATGPLADVAGPLSLDSHRPATRPARSRTAPTPPDATAARDSGTNGHVVTEPARNGRGRRAAANRSVEGAPVLPDALIRQVQDFLPRARSAAVTAAEPLPSGPGGERQVNALPAGPGPRAVRGTSLRSLVHATLDERVPAGDPRDNVMLIDLVTDVLDLDELERLSAANYVHTWRQGVDSGRRVSAL